MRQGYGVVELANAADFCDSDDCDRFYDAVRSRDPRFDGWFFTAVTSTGIYCRPSCPAQTPKRENACFYPSSAAAQQAGFRACKRCRPDAAPGSPAWNSRADVVARAMRMIADGVVDRAGVSGLARELGYSVRQLQRLLLAELGAGPIALARAQRAQTARILIETTDLSMTQIAFAAGFSSVRQFNDTVRAVFASTPRDLRDRAARRGRGGRDGARKADGDGHDGPVSPHGELTLKLPYRSPLNPQNLFGHLAATAIPGVEEVTDGSYRRALRLAHGTAIAQLRPADGHVVCSLLLSDIRDLTAAIARCRWLLDLDADPAAVDAHLARDRTLAAAVAAGPGRRVPRCVDGAEMAIRAVLGQQVSTAAARTLAGRLASAHGEPIDDPGGGLTHTFPSPRALAGAEPAMPAARRRALAALAVALADGALVLTPGADHEAARAALADLPGVGAWTTEIIAMRALGDPDAFPVTDLGVTRGAAKLGIARGGSALSHHAQAWRPWRAYAVQYLWATHEHPVNHWPPPIAPSERNSHVPRRPRADRPRADHDRDVSEPAGAAASDLVRGRSDARAHARAAPRRRARA